MPQARMDFEKWMGISNRTEAAETDPTLWDEETINATVRILGTVEKRPGSTLTTVGGVFVAPVRGGFQIEDRIVLTDGATFKKATISSSY